MIVVPVGQGVSEYEARPGMVTTHETQDHGKQTEPLGLGGDTAGESSGLPDFSCVNPSDRTT